MATRTARQVKRPLTTDEWTRIVDKLGMCVPLTAAEFEQVITDRAHWRRTAQHWQEVHERQAARLLALDIELADLRRKLAQSKTEGQAN